jgi:hypothetical protein
MSILSLLKPIGRRAVAGLLLWAAPGAGRAADDFYINNGVVQVPPQDPSVVQIDATNFVNNNTFFVALGSNLFFDLPYETFSTRNYTNRGSMTCDLGFRFRNNPPQGQGGTWKWSDNFQNTGLISAGASDSGFFFTFDLPRIQIYATNIIMRGTNIVGPDGLFQATGDYLDFNRSAIQMQSPNLDFGFGTGSTAVGGVSDQYWGLEATNSTINPAQFEQSPPTTPFHEITEAGNYFNTFTRLVLTNGVGYTQDTTVGSNRTVQVAFLANPNPAFSNNVYFFGNSIVVEWIWQTQDPLSGAGTTNYMYLYDNLPSYTGTNFVLITRTSGGLVTARPVNYSFQFGGPYFLGTPSPVSPPVGVLPTALVTNDYTAYSAGFSASSLAVGEQPGTPSITNLPGRIEFNASKALDLKLARIAGLNYLKLAAPNHFVGSEGAKILSVYADLNLRSTNGSLTITNLLLPEVPRLVGDVNLYSTRFSQVVGSVSNDYHVLFVQSLLETGGPSQVQDIFLTASNSISISDEFNILRSLRIDTANLTLTTNGPTAATPTGTLQLLAPGVVDAAEFPSLRNLTNYGIISTPDAMVLGSSSQPLETIENHGQILTAGAALQVRTFNNPGLISGGPGSLNLNATTATLTNGFFLATNGDVALHAGSLLISNNVLVAGRLLSLSLTNVLDDGGVNGSNYWVTGRDGLQFLHAPVQGDLLGTTIASTIGAFDVTPILWAAVDWGRGSSGFTNNAAVGRLLLDGGVQSLYSFQAASISNAMYVDYIELSNYTTNLDEVGNLSGLTVESGMKLYYGDIVANGESIAERVSGKSDGRLVWVADYAGFYSGTNVLYPDGTTNRLNRALVTSCNLDSDGDLIPNCMDPTPVLVDGQLGFRAALTNAAVSLSWNAVQDSTSTVEYKSTLAETNWTVLTNVTVTAVPPYGARPVRVTDPVLSSNRFYRVKVTVPQP